VDFFMTGQWLKPRFCHAMHAVVEEKNFLLAYGVLEAVETLR
jgi:hypothetical protein